MRAFIHIGAEKTGTTSLQAFLDAARERLAEQGLRYLRSPGARSHRKLAAYCLRKDRADDFFRDCGLSTPERRKAFREAFLRQTLSELANAQRDGKDVLVSSEHLHSRLCFEDELWTLRALFAPFCAEIVVIVYLRPQVEAAVSSYSTALRRGRTQALWEYLDSCCSPETLAYDYASSLAMWEKVFGRENLRVRLLEPDTLVGGELVSDFLALAGLLLPQEAARRLPRLNRSANPFGQGLMRALNKSLARGGGHRLEPLREELANLVAERSAGPASDLDAVVAERMHSRFEAGNEAVRRRYFPERERLFRSPAGATAQAPEGRHSCDGALSPEQEDLLEAVFDRFRMALARAEARAARLASCPEG